LQRVANTGSASLHHDTEILSTRISGVSLSMLRTHDVARKYFALLVLSYLMFHTVGETTSPVIRNEADQSVQRPGNEMDE